MLQRLSYFSRASGELDLQALVARAALANAKAGITGLLLVEGEYYLQVLEGPRDGVSALFLRIANDQRHHDVTLIEVGSIEGTSYPDWGMSRFENVNRTVALYPTGPQSKFDPKEMSAHTLRDFIRLATFELLSKNAQL